MFHLRSVTLLSRAPQRSTVGPLATYNVNRVESLFGPEFYPTIQFNSIESVIEVIYSYIS